MKVPNGNQPDQLWGVYPCARESKLSDVREIKGKQEAEHGMSLHCQLQWLSVVFLETKKARNKC